MNGYYNIKSSLTSQDLLTIADENKITKTEIDAEEQEVKQQRRPVKVRITGYLHLLFYFFDYAHVVLIVGDLPAFL